MKKITAVTSSVFTYCIFVNTPEADAFSQVALPVGVSSTAVSKTSLAAASGQHNASCQCSMCSVGRDLSSVRMNKKETGSLSPSLGRIHGPGCPCDDCSQAVSAAAHGNGCPCNSCSQAAKATHGESCNCRSCLL